VEGNKMRYRWEGSLRSAGTRCFLMRKSNWWSSRPYVVGKALCSGSRLRQPPSMLVGDRHTPKPASMDLVEAMNFGIDTSISRTFYAVSS
jgi:hypothetical protein